MIEKWKAISSGSESTTSENAVAKTRRKSFFIYWDKALDVPKTKQKLRKDRLNCRKNSSHNLNINCTASVQSRPKRVRSTTIQLRRSTWTPCYTSKHKRRSTKYFLCLWREKTKPKQLSDLLQNIFETNFEAMDEDDENGVVKATKIKINDEHTIQNCLGPSINEKQLPTQETTFSKTYSKRTNDFWLALGPSTKYPGFYCWSWKAKVDDKDIFDMCTEMLGVEHLFPKRYKNKTDGKPTTEIDHRF